MIGYDGGPARGRGDRHRLRLVAVVRRAVGRVREAQRRRLGHDHHRRAGERHGRGHGAAACSPPRCSAWTPEDFSILYQDTDAGPWDMGSSGSQTTFNNGRAVIAAASEVREQLLDAAAEELEAAREDLELRRRRRARQGLAGQGGLDRRPRRRGHAAARQGLGRRAGGADRSRATACVGRLGMESFLAPQLITHAVHVKVDRETGVVRVLRVAAAHDSGMIVNQIGADGQVYGGVVMGIGQALTRGHPARRGRPPAQPAPARLQARHASRTRRRSRSAGSRSRRRTPARRARRASASRRASPPRAPSATRSRSVDRPPRHALPMTPERVWARRRERR